jgi:hypothetical protein
MVKDESILTALGIFGSFGLGLSFLITIGIAEIVKDYRIEKYKKTVENYVDKDKNGIDKIEECQIYNLMDIQNKSKGYFPTLKDWKRAYNNINSLEKISKQ